MGLQIGVARTRLSPPWGVELAGWGYYLGRTWQRVRDDTAATALVVDDGRTGFALVAVDLMYLDAAFTAAVRRHVRQAGEGPSAICVACSHSHTTPTAAFIRGAGEMDADYLHWAARQTATAVLLAWQGRRPGSLHVGKEEVAGWTYNRTRPDGPVETRLSVWRFDDAAGRPLAAVVNYQAHPVILMNLGAADLSRDWPGQVTDLLESVYPGLTALYLQGSCGDVNFEERWNDPSLCREPGRYLGATALRLLAAARRVDPPTVSAATRQVTLPTRRWSRDEVTRFRDEGAYRLETGDTTGWLDGIARAIVNKPGRLPERYGGDVTRTVRALGRFAVEWGDKALMDLDTRPEELTTEVQALRVGDAWLVSNPAELFSSLALDLRRRWPHDDLMIAGYANASIGYVPDDYDIQRGGYAAVQSPKFKDQFPFTPRSGPALVGGMLDALAATEPRAGG